uniref:Interleukin 6 cytokine family signal transduce n=1 Tax=Electrophorus electricus TaxID=8005 RepID=A0AAY5EZ87_ELEEL
ICRNYKKFKSNMTIPDLLYRVMLTIYRNYWKFPKHTQLNSVNDACNKVIKPDLLNLPIKPENLQCIALQKGKRVSPNLTCHWDPGEHAPDSNTSYILYAQYSYKKLANNLTVDLGSFPIYMETKVWVEVKNELGSVNSTELLAHAECFVKPNPPSNVMLIPEANFSMSLIVNWTHSFYLKLKYNIRYCQAGSSVWNEVPQSATESYIESFRLQFLQPYTDYVVQMRCINQKGIGYWSDWSPNATARTPEAKPESKSDLWRVYEEKNNTVVKLIWKDPVKSNGKILGYNITVEENGVSAERHVVHSKEHQLHIKGEKMFIRMTAHNSAGVSPVASLVVPRSSQVLRAGAEQVRWSVRDGQLWVDWLPPSGSKWLLRVFEYVLEWVSVPEGKRDCRKSWPKKKCQLIQSPLRGPSVEATETQKTVFHLKWEEIPVTSQRGFLTNYTIFYKTGDNEQFVVVRSEFHSHKLTELASASRYVVCVMASNMEGSVNGSESILYTKYGMYFVKRRCNTTQLYLHLVNILKIAKLPDLSIMEVGMFDGKSLCEEDKTVLPLKKDKYFSEEHSSGIGGSSCMSSPRQSVSDNDEGDSCQTTASTMQYSSVVASGYKGQTPSLQAPVFARSESTQPLLESEEHPEHLLEGSRHWTSGQGIEQQQMQEGKSSYNSLNFCPVAKKKYTPTLTEDPPGLTPCYMPQQSGH